MELIVIALLGLIVAGGGEGQKEKQIVCPIEVIQDGKLVLVEGDYEDAAGQTKPNPPPVPCETGCTPPPPPPCETNCGPNPDPEKVKSDNSDANGKGGNKHDRDDKDDKPAHEKAEDKKAKK